MSENTNDYNSHNANPRSNLQQHKVEINHAHLRQVPVLQITLATWICWTLLLGISMAWNTRNEHESVIKQAHSEAEGHFNKDIAYRRWVAKQGGVYVHVSSYTTPNPNLGHVAERDITTTTGRELTLVNPAYMTRQVMELSERQYGVRGHITSLNVLRPENVPDDWEKEALKAFKTSQKEYVETTTIEGEPYLRFMRPFITEEGCLRCHAVQGYTTGAVRGGVSVSIPLKKYYAIRHANVIAISSWHLITYLFGSGIILLGGRYIHKRVQEREAAYLESNLNQQRFKSLLNLTRTRHKDEEQLLRYALDEAIRISASEIGYLHFYSATRNTLNFAMWDKQSDSQYQGMNKGAEVSLNLTGIWADAIRKKQPVVHNDYPGVTHKKGLPQWHLPIKRHLSVPIWDGDNIVGILGVGNKADPYTPEDITQLSLYANSLWEIIKNTRAEIELTEHRHELKRFRALLEQVSDCIFIADSYHGRILDVNESACTQTGYSRNELLKMTLERFIALEHWDTILSSIRKDSAKLFEFTCQRKDGSIFSAETNARSIELDGQEYIVASLRDISRRKATEEELHKYRTQLEQLVEERTASLKSRTDELERSQRDLKHLLIEINAAKHDLEQANAKLQELDRLKSMFIASMSHELRTPLNSIIGFSSLVLNGMSGEINTQQRDQLERVYRSGKHLLTLITDVIDIAKIESGRIQPYYSDFELKELLDEACSSMAVQLKDKGLTLGTEVEDIAEMEMHTDRKRLHQCVLNYLSNAVKFTPEGNIVLSAKIDTDSDEITIAVSDSGIGIAPDDLDHLFQPFSRLETPLKVTTTGTGLGLYLTRKLATEVLGGKVWVESEIGVGSCFYLKIPQRINA